MHGYVDIKYYLAKIQIMINSFILIYQNMSRKYGYVLKASNTRKSVIFEAISAFLSFRN